MNRKQVTLTTLCFIIQICFVFGFPVPEDAKAKPAADAPKADASKTDAPKADASKDAAAATAEKPADEAKKDTPTTEGTDSATAGSTTAAAQMTPEQLQTLLASITSGSTGSTPNPQAMAQSLIGALKPLAQMMQNTQDGLTNIYLDNRPHNVDLIKGLTDPVMEISRFLLTPVGLGETPEQLRSAVLKAGMDMADNGVQIANVVAGSAPTFIRTIEKTGNGLVNMKPLSF